MNREAVLRVADVIEHLENLNDGDDSSPEESKDKFEMSSYSFGCGTPACIAGWTTWLYHPEIIRGFADLNTIKEDPEEFAMNVLELDELQATALFRPKFPTAHYAAVPGEDDYITPTRAAAYLRRFAETGEIVWDTIQEEK